MRKRRWITGIVLPWSCLAGVCAYAEDPFFARDKYLHFAGSMVLSAAVTQASGSTTAGFWAGVGAGVLKETYDHYHPGEHMASAKDLAWGVMGAYVGSRGMGWYLGRRAGYTVIGYTQRF